MYIDILFLALVGLLLVLGLISGFLSQILKIIALVAASLLASPLSPYARGLLANWVEVDTLFGDVLSLIVAWIGCYLVLVVAGKILIRLIRGSSTSLKSLDRILGGLLGGFKGALIVYLLVCVVLFFGKPLEQVVPAEYLDLKDSRVAAFAKEFNVVSLLDLPDVDKLQELAAGFENDEKRKALLNDPGIRKIQQNPAFQNLIEDPEFKQALAGENIPEILQNKSFRDAINDPEIRRFLSKLDIKSLQQGIKTNRQ